MFRVQYAGPKVEITHQGIKYSDAKEDKFVYLMVALEILQGIDNDYDQKPLYKHHFEHKIVDDEVIHKTLALYENELEEKVEEEEKEYELMIEHELEHIQNLPYLTEVDRKVWIKNIELMKPYRIQRQINKIYYGHCIQDIVDVIKSRGIRDIITPFNKDFFHVMNSINNVLSTDLTGCDTILSEENDSDGNMVMRLQLQRSLNSGSYNVCF